jgi:hypothetical protein
MVRLSCSVGAIVGIVYWHCKGEAMGMLFLVKPVLVSSCVCRLAWPSGQAKEQ